VSNVKMSTETVTPDLARRLLNGMGLNRNVRKGHVARIANAMKEGMFNGLNGETLVIDESGHLIDGQHRLNALLESGVKSVTMLVVRGVPAAAKDTMGQGIQRTPGDVLGFHGHKSVNVLAASARWLYVYENDWPGGIRSRGATSVTTPVIVATVKQHPELEVAVDEIITKFPKAARLMTQSIAGFTRLVTDRLSSADSEEFFTVMETGEGSPKTKSVRVLRDKLLSRTSKSGRLVAPEIVVLTARVWNAFREGKELTKLFVGKNLDDPYTTAPRFK